MNRTTFRPQGRIARPNILIALAVGGVFASASHLQADEGILRPEIQFEDSSTATTESAGLFASVSDPFAITVVFPDNSLTPAQQAAFTIAADTWDSYITGYKPGVNRNGVTIEARAADLAPGILGQAGPTSVVNSGGFTVATQGIMTFDDTFVANANPTSFQNVILHEMGHVLGIGILWDIGLNNVYVDGSGQYTGAFGLQAYRNEFNQPAATFVPVELEGNVGTFDFHWDENLNGAGPTGIVSSITGLDMQRELMTGWLNSPTFTSTLTVMSLMDIGFTVVPEPSTCALLAMALVTTSIKRRR